MLFSEAILRKRLDRDYFLSELGRLRYQRAAHLRDVSQVVFTGCSFAANPHIKDTQRLVPLVPISNSQGESDRVAKPTHNVRPTRMTLPSTRYETLGLNFRDCYKPSSRAKANLELLGEFVSVIEGLLDCPTSHPKTHLGFEFDSCLGAVSFGRFAQFLDLRPLLRTHRSTRGRCPRHPQVIEECNEFIVRFEDVRRPLFGRHHRTDTLSQGKLVDRQWTSGAQKSGSGFEDHVVELNGRGRFPTSAPHSNGLSTGRPRGLSFISFVP